MPQKVKVLYTPFEGDKKIYESTATACEDLGLRYKSIAVKFNRQENAGRSKIHVWEQGKIEALD